ncbi:MAG TPA: class I SAM-dependent methyltransferase [Thermoanaerobaculia bacterium]|jgi:hypothetical protein
MSQAQQEIDQLVDDRYLAASDVAVGYVRGLAARILARLGLWERVARPAALPAVAAALGTLPELSFALAWLLEEAGAAGLVGIERGPSPGESLYRPNRLPAEPELSDEDRRRIAETIGSSFELFNYVAALYPEYLRGERSGPAILLKAPALRLWEKYFGPTNPLYDIHNQLGWIGTREAARRLGRPVNVLELGAGSGGGTEAVLRGLQREGGSVTGLTVSDVSPTFLVNTLERLAREIEPFPVPVQRRRLDFTRPLADQGIAPGSVDVLLGVNALHNSSDLVASIGTLGPSLAAGGALIISESLCLPGGHVHQDFVFNLLPLEGRAHSASSSRFLHAAAWEEILRAAGFTAEVYRNSAGPELALLAIVRPARS